jgi:hypothetical protein
MSFVSPHFRTGQHRFSLTQGSFNQAYTKNEETLGLFIFSNYQYVTRQQEEIRLRGGCISGGELKIA